jgi:hypothetical protein
MKTALAAAALFMALSRTAAAASYTSAAQGTTTADFLNLAVGARAVGMGEAYSAVADEATAMYWNPASLTRIEHRSVTAMHAMYIASSYFDYAAYGQNLGQYGAFGAGVQYFSAGSIAETDPSGTDIGSFAPYDLAVAAGYAYTFKGVDFLSDLDGFSVGVSGKYVQSRILVSAQTEAFDLGLLSPAYFSNRLRVSFTATNIGGNMVFEQASEPLPSNMRLGGAFKVTRDWTISSDVVFPSNNTVYGAVGTEWWLANGGGWKLAGRAGFNSQDFGNVSGLTGVSLGFGLGYKSTVIDYAFVPFGGLGQTHRISLSYNF